MAFDEGQRNVAFHLSRELLKRHTVVHLNARHTFFFPVFWYTVRKFSPAIIHILLRPNASTLIYSKVLKCWCLNARVIISALQPPTNPKIVSSTIRFLKPDMVLPLSEITEELFTLMGCKTTFLGCGVDTEKFLPVTQGKKIALRVKYEIDKDKFIILHVGSITSGRNLFDLVKLQKIENNQVIVVTNTTFEPDSEVYCYLKSNGCIFFRKYFENIEEIYQLADCYIFPTLNASYCIELPLSILEAMACNLPVITTRFGAISRVFTNGEGLFFVDNIDDIHLILKKIKNNKIIIKTREKVINLTWEKVAHDLERIYKNLINSK